MRRSDAGDFIGHRFEERHAEAIIDRGQDEYVATLIEVVDVRHVAHDFDIGDAPQPLRERRIMCKVGIGADQQPRIGKGEALPGFEEIKIAFAPRIAANYADGELGVPRRMSLRGKSASAEERGFYDLALQRFGKCDACVVGGGKDVISLCVLGELTVAEPLRLGAEGNAELCRFLLRELLLEIDMRTGAIENEARSAPLCSVCRG